MSGEIAMGGSSWVLLESVTAGTGCISEGILVVEDVATQIPVGVHCPGSGVKVVAERTSTRAAGWRSLLRVSALRQLCTARTPCWLSALNPCSTASSRGVTASSGEGWWWRSRAPSTSFLRAPGSEWRQGAGDAAW